MGQRGPNATGEDTGTDSEAAGFGHCLAAQAFARQQTEQQQTGVGRRDGNNECNRNEGQNSYGGRKRQPQHSAQLPRHWGGTESPATGPDTTRDQRVAKTCRENSRMERQAAGNVTPT